MLESEKYEQLIRITKIVDEEYIEKNSGLGLKIGDTYSVIPNATNKGELFEQFEKLYAAKVFEAHQQIFHEKYGNSASTKILKDELQTLNKFIDEANKLSTVETFENKDYSHSHEYSRLANNFYQIEHKTKDSNLNYHSYFNNIAAHVYGKYFLYKNWLDNLLQEQETYLRTNNKSYLLTDFYKEQHQNILTNKSMMEFEGFFKIIYGDEKKIIKVYTPELAEIFCNLELELLEVKTKSKESIDINDIIDLYAKSFFEGEEYFSHNFTILYNPESAKLFVKDLHTNYKHNPITKYSNHNLNKGWEFVKKTYPTHLSENSIKKYGFYAGVISSADELIARHPSVFNEYDECSLENNEKDNSEPKVTLKQLALLYFYKGEQINRGNADEIVTRYGHSSGEKLFHHYTHYSSRANRKGEPTSPSKKKLENKIKLFEDVFELLPSDKRNEISDELEILKGIYVDKYE